MDRLLVLEPQDLTLRFELNKKSVAAVQLQNVMHTMPVAFKVQTSAPKKYMIKPQYGIISPLGAVTCEIIMIPQEEFPDTYPHCSDDFVVKSVVVPGGSRNESVVPEWFTAKKKAVFSDKRLKITFVGGGILRNLVRMGYMDEMRTVLDKDRSVIDVADEQGFAPIHLAVSSGKPELVQLLLEYKASLQVQTAAGQTPLHQAAQAGQTLITELLLANGADTGARNSTGWAALHYATVRGHVDVMRLLIENGSNIDAPICDGRTALHIALSEGHKHCVKLLLDSNCNVDAKSSTGVTALHIAASRGQVGFAKLLLDRGANTDVIDCTGKTPYDGATEAGQTLLFDALRLGDDLRLAARRGDLNTVTKCLEHGVDIDGPDQSGWTALQRAAFKGHIDIVQYLLKQGANIDRTDHEGYSVLHVATEANQKEIVELLVRKGANVNQKTHKGLTAMHLSTRLNYTGISRVLVEGGVMSARGATVTHTPPSQKASFMSPIQPNFTCKVYT